MTFSFGGPVDPGWEPFQAGLKAHFDDLAKPCPRWHAQHNKWYFYPLDKWYMVETTLPALDPGSVIDPTADFSAGHLVTKLKISSYGLDTLFTKVRDCELKNRAKHGPLVWNPVDGAWRRVVVRSAAPPPPPPPTPPRVAELINQVNALRDAGVITPSQADEAVQRILDSVT